MSDFALWAMGLEGTIILSLIGTLWTIQQKRIKSIETMVNSIARQTYFAAFQAMDTARAEGWYSWREDRVENTLNDHERRLQTHTAEIARMLGRMNGNHK